MDKLTEILRAYARANNIETRIDFRRKKLIFCLERGEAVQEEVANSIEFSGFVDGYQGRPHRYKGPKGASERLPLAELIDETVNKISEKFKMNNDVKKLLITGVEIELPEDRYDRQYQLGTLYK